MNENNQNQQNSGPKRGPVKSTLPRLYWSPQVVRIGSGGNLRECQTVMDEALARAWCREQGVEFVKVARPA